MSAGSGFSVKEMSSTCWVVSKAVDAPEAALSVKLVDVAPPSVDAAEIVGSVSVSASTELAGSHCVSTSVIRNENNRR